MDSEQGMIVDAGPLIYLAKIDALDIFRPERPGGLTEGVRRETLVPQATYRFPEIVAIERALAVGQLRLLPMHADEQEAAADLERRIPGLGTGERESIAVAQGRTWSALLFDRRAARIARSMGIQAVTPIEILLARTVGDDLLARRIRRLAGLTDMRIDALEQILERVKERSRW
ncbi:MAG: hypothetical protein M3406_06475 [Chloroflexota bacterium]|nr:hypothetical protein [Chloroflexota bacterium]